VFDTLQQLLNQMIYYFQSGQVQDLGLMAYVIFLVLVFFEGTLITFLAGMGSAAGWLNPFAIFVLAVAGNTLTDCLWYGLGYIGTMEWVAGSGWVIAGSRRAKRIWRRLGSDVTLGQVNEIQARMHEHAPRILFIAKLTAGFTVASLIASGLIRVRHRRWMPPVMLAQSIRSAIIMALGYQMSTSVSQFEPRVGWLFLAGVLAMLAYVSWYLRHQARRWLLG
jgi:membrane protein DedA with SNARE-associated domain